MKLLLLHIVSRALGITSILNLTVKIYLDWFMSNKKEMKQRMFPKDGNI